LASSLKLAARCPVSGCWLSCCYNSDKRQQIFKTFHCGVPRNTVWTRCTNFHLTLDALVHYSVKFVCSKLPRNFHWYVKG